MERTREHDEHVIEPEDPNALAEQLRALIGAVTDDVCRTIVPEDAWPFDDRERAMMREAGYIFV